MVAQKEYQETVVQALRDWHVAHLEAKRDSYENHGRPPWTAEDLTWLKENQPGLRIYVENNPALTSGSRAVSGASGVPVRGHMSSDVWWESHGLPGPAVPPVELLYNDAHPSCAGKRAIRRYKLPTPIVDGLPEGQCTNKYCSCSGPKASE